MRKKFGSPLKVLGQTVALLVAAYVFGSPALVNFRPGFLNTPFEQFYLAVNSVLRDGKIDEAISRKLTGNVSDDWLCSNTFFNDSCVPSGPKISSFVFGRYAGTKNGKPWV